MPDQTLIQHVLTPVGVHALGSEGRLGAGHQATGVLR